MEHARSLFSLLGPREEAPAFGRSERLLVAVIALLAALACAAGWGALVGASSRHAVADAVLAPVLLLASSLTALPLTLFVARVFGRGFRLSSLLLAYATGAFGGTLVMLLVAPLVALYQHSSVLVGGAIGPASALLGMTFGAFVFVRTLGRLGDTPQARRGVLLPALLLFTLQVLAMAQLASVMPPLFQARTTIGHGVDVLDRASER